MPMVPVLSAADTVEHQRWTSVRALAGLLLPVTTLLVFAPTLATHFAQDDYQMLAAARFKTWGELSRLFWPYDIFWYTWPFDGSQYRPLMFMYFAALVRQYGLNPHAFQAINIALVLLNAGLLGLLGRRLGMSPAAALAASTFYAGHSALMAWVMWTGTSNGSLAVLFSLATMLAYFHGGRAARYVSPVLLAIGLTARETTVVIPLLVTVAILCSSDRPLIEPFWRRAKAALRHTWMLWAVAVAYLLLRLPAIARPAHGHPYALRLGGHVLQNAVTLLGNATGLLTATGVFDNFWSWAFRVAFWSIVIGYVAVQWTRGRRLPLAWLIWFTVGILPVVFLSGHRMDPHYLDTALLGLALACGAIADAVLRNLPSIITRRATAICFWCAFILMSGLSVRAEYAVSPISYQARRARAAFADIRTNLTTLPPNATVYLFGSDPGIAHALGYGDLIRLEYDHPSIHTGFSHRGDPLPPLEHRRGDFFAFEYRSGRMIECSSRVRCFDAPSSQPAPAGPPVMRAVHPATTHAGQDFNPQPGAASALSVECYGAVPGTLVLWDETPLQSTFGGPHWVSALVPRPLYNRAGEHKIRILSDRGCSESCAFVVQP